MNLFPNFESPFKPLISFQPVIEDWESRLSQNPDDCQAKDLLQRVRTIPELAEGFTGTDVISKNKELIADLLSCIFPKMLTGNQISAVTFPWCNTVINPTQRFEEIIKESGKDFCINNGNFSEENFYIASCSFIISRYYNISLSEFFPLYFQFKDKLGINRQYRIIYNPDFLEVTPTKDAVKLNSEDLELLLDNMTDIELWKQKFPPKSWTIKGFGIMNMYNTTVETAFTNLKQRLSSRMMPTAMDDDSENELLKSIFNIESLDVGISGYDPLTQSIVYGFYNLFTESLLLRKIISKQRGFRIAGSELKAHIEENKPLIISDIPKYFEKHPNDTAIHNLMELGYNSCALIPLKKENEFLGIAELASVHKMAFSSLVFYRINMLYSFLVNRLERAVIDFSNLKNSIIQKEYTRLHPSVAWKFEKEAENYLKNTNSEYNFKEIVFQDVVALYGQVDIRNSSETRNQSIKSDFEAQIGLLLDVLKELKTKTGIELLSQKEFELKDRFEKLTLNFESGTESEIQKYISEEIHPILSNPTIYTGEDGIVSDYLKSLDPYTGQYYRSRKKFDDSVSLINKRLSNLLDERQKEIQKIFPHYFERFRTDGVEHTMYIGESISPDRKYNPIFLQNLRLWQLQVICEMLDEHRKIKPKLPLPLEVAALILVFNQPFSIRFRMDEKRFDVDGTYNAQYEVVKKRIDKSHVKGSSKRITQPGKIAIIYSNTTEEKEYKKYIRFLQSKNILDKTVEHLDVEDFQGVTGMKAIRVGLSENSQISNNTYFDYKDFVKSVN
ncbi:MAG: GAF domain-containing protein [Moheibacter sp.]